MEAMFALDFVSLLLSKHTPRQAEMSMSAYLKQVAPLGSLNSEIVNPPPKPESAARDTKNVSRGWRLQNFNSAASKLLDSATRLEAEVASETRYWDEVLAVKEKGWKVSRLPRERQALGVQYGFLEGEIDSFQYCPYTDSCSYSNLPRPGLSGSATNQRRKLDTRQRFNSTQGANSACACEESWSNHRVLEEPTGVG